MTDTQPIPAFLARRGSAPHPLPLDAEQALHAALGHLEQYDRAATDEAHRDETPVERIYRLLADEPDELAEAAWESTLTDQYATPDDENPVVSEEARADLHATRGALRAAWRIEQDGQAEWALRRLRDVRASRAEKVELAKTWKAEVDAWLADVDRPLGRSEAFFDGALQDYMRRLREADPKKASHKLPSGTLKSTARKPEVAVGGADLAEEAVIAWARENLKGEELDEVVKVVTEVRVSKLRKHAVVSAEQIGQRLEVELDCGHVAPVDLPADAEDIDARHAAAALEETWPCPDCVSDFDGAGPRRGVVRVDLVPVEVPVVRSSATGQIVPGALVTPARTTYRVELA